MEVSINGKTQQWIFANLEMDEWMMTGGTPI